MLFACLLLKLRCGTAGDVVHMKHARSFKFYYTVYFLCITICKTVRTFVILVVSQTMVAVVCIQHSLPIPAQERSWPLVLASLPRSWLCFSLGLWCISSGLWMLWWSNKVIEMTFILTCAWSWVKEWSPQRNFSLCEFFVPVEKYDYPFNTVDRPRAVLPQFWRSPKIESMLNESWIVESC